MFGKVSFGEECILEIGQIHLSIEAQCDNHNFKLYSGILLRSLAPFAHEHSLLSTSSILFKMEVEVSLTFHTKNGVMYLNVYPQYKSRS